MNKNALDLRQIYADSLWALSANSAVHPSIFTDKSRFEADNADDDEDDDGKKEGSATVEEMRKGSLPLEFLVMYLIRKNRPEKAFALMIKAMDKARTPAKMAEIMGVAYIAVEELKAMQYWNDIKQIQDYILIGSAPTGTDIHRNQHLVIDYDLFTSASTPKSYAIKEASGALITSDCLSGTFEADSWDLGWQIDVDATLLSTFAATPKSYAIKEASGALITSDCLSGAFEADSWDLGWQIDADATSFTYGESLEFIEYTSLPSFEPRSFGAISSYKPVVKLSEFAYEMPDLIDLGMVSAIGEQEGQTGFITEAFMSVSYERDAGDNSYETYHEDIIDQDTGHEQFDSFDLEAGKISFVQQLKNLINDGKPSVAIERLFKALDSFEDQPELIEALRAFITQDIAPILRFGGYHQQLKDLLEEFDLSLEEFEFDIPRFAA